MSQVHKYLNSLYFPKSVYYLIGRCTQMSNNHGNVVVAVKQIELICRATYVHSWRRKMETAAELVGFES
jgi:hypothetical protein